MNDFYKAFVAFCGEVTNAEKNATNPHFNKKYADLSEILNTVRPVLAKHCLGFYQSPSFADGLVTVKTVIFHSSGGAIENEFSLPCSQNNPQGVGSALTYCRRYSLTSLCGISQEDDYGNQSSGRNGVPQKDYDLAVAATKEATDCAVTGWGVAITTCKTLEQLYALRDNGMKNLPVSLKKALAAVYKTQESLLQVSPELQKIIDDAGGVAQALEQMKSAYANDLQAAQTAENSATQVAETEASHGYYQPIIKQLEALL